MLIILTQENIYQSWSSDHTYQLTEDIVLDQPKLIRDLSNITILGVGHKITLTETGGIDFKNCSNIQIQDLTVIGRREPDADGSISIQFNTCFDVKIERCTFVDGQDEQVSIKNGSDRFVFEHCKFLHNHNEQHAFSVLIGKNRRDIPKGGSYHVVFYCCYFYKGSGRHPRFRNTILHMINCVWEGGSSYCIGAEDGEIYLDTCLNLSGCAIVGKFGSYRINYNDTEARFLEFCIDRNIERPDYGYEIIPIDELYEKV